MAPWPKDVPLPPSDSDEKEQEGEGGERKGEGEEEGDHVQDPAHSPETLNIDPSTVLPSD